MKLNNNQKKLLKELTKISLKKGYWSDDVRRFNSKLDFTTMNLINNHYLNK